MLKLIEVEENEPLNLPEGARVYRVCEDWPSYIVLVPANDEAENEA